MEVAAVAVQQAILQSQMSVAMVKNMAKAEQAIVNLIAQAASSGNLGNNLNIRV